MADSKKKKSPFPFPPKKGKKGDKKPMPFKKGGKVKGC